MGLRGEVQEILPYRYRGANCGGYTGSLSTTAIEKRG